MAETKPFEPDPKRPRMIREVLVIDGDPKMRANIKSVFVGKGYKMVEAEGEEQLFRLLRIRGWKWQPCAIITDLILPGASGFDLIRRLAERFEGKQVPIIIHSQMGTADDVLEAQFAGASAYVKKPIAIERVLQALNQTIKNSGKKPGEGERRILVVGLDEEETE